MQIAGLVARRIVTFAAEGESIGAASASASSASARASTPICRVGATALVAVGQRAIGGETVFADLKSTEAEREARRH